MTKGIYVVANDRVIDHAIALLNSIRFHDQEIPVFLIPFNEDYKTVASTLKQLHQVQLFPNLELVDYFTQKVAEIFDRDFLALPNKMRKLVAWFGPLDEFLYIDTDVVVFEKISESLNQLSKFGFLCCDYHHTNEGLKNIFSPLVKEQNLFTEKQLQDVFNSGFWASRRDAITEQQMYDTLRECSQHREYFDFSHGVTDQPILNYLALKLIPNRCNLVRIPGGGPGSWAGSKHFQQKDHVLYDRGERLKYLHWAGTPIRPGGAYWELWQHYRYLHEANLPLLSKLTRRLLPFVAARK